MNTAANHDIADDVAEWAIKNMAALRTAEIDTRRCSGNCNQGRACDCGPKEAASSCTEIGADGVPSVWESADFEVFVFYAKGIGALIAAAFLFWAYANA